MWRLSVRKTLVVACCALALSFAAGCSKKEKAEGENVAAAKTEVAAGAKVDSVAHVHLPEGCQMVATIDYQKLRELKSVKANIEAEIAKLDKPKDGQPGPKDQDIKDMIEFLEKTDINLRTDPSEIAMCFTNMDKGKEEPLVVVVIGGKFRPGAAMEVMDSLTEKFKGLLRRAATAGDSKKSEPEIIDIAGHKVLHDKTENVYLAQAKDGAFIIGNDRAQFEKSLNAGKAHESYKLSKEVLGVVLTKAMAPMLSEGTAGSPFDAAMKSFSSATVGISEHHVLAELTLDDEKQVTELKGTLELLVKQMSAQPGNPMGPMLSGAKISAAGKVLTVDVAIPEEAVNGLIRQMGGQMGGPGLGGPGVGGPGMVAPPGGAVPAAPAAK